ncbi:peptide N-acetyl-beta-D-glucosaminyl asparaginase amidase A-domain-containing protein [Cladorrhinum sp. PSN332]|nr:peptide N-acetyl-beta-D-glucosaminyl asparaginase amidase A-domain-containing protein [Cladorrhinum sp. PSN332]
MASQPDPEKHPFMEDIDLTDDEDPPQSSNPSPSVFILFSLLLTFGLVFYNLPIPSCLPSTATKHAHEILHFNTPNFWRSISHQVNSRADDPIPTPTPRTEVLRNFEVAVPVLMPDGSPADSDGTTTSKTTEKECTVLLMRRDFAWSYNDPFIGQYTPPPCAFNRILLNFTVVSHGRQYDRLAFMFLGDTEIWRTSTAEPVAPPGISWTYLKDVTHYLSLFQQPQKIIFDLGNLINEKYTGIFNTTLTATFYTDPSSTESQSKPANSIIPISPPLSELNKPSYFSLPAQPALLTLPQLPPHTTRAVITVSANGQSTEEFWWSNVLEEDKSTFVSPQGAGELPGLSPFREIQVLIDDALVGVVWPFPVIFTGGVVPSLHRPIAGIEAFDLREGTVDVSPWLDELKTGESKIEIRVAGLNAKGEVTKLEGEYWVLSGKVFLWYGDDGNAQSGSVSGKVTVDAPEPKVKLWREVELNKNGTANETLKYTTEVRRSLLVKKGDVTWSQELKYSNEGYASAYGYDQINDMRIEGVDTSSSGYQAKYVYPLFANSSYTVSPLGNLSISAFLMQGKELTVRGEGVFPTGLEAFTGDGSGKKYEESRLGTRKAGTAEFRQTGDGMISWGWGDSTQVFLFEGDGEELYWRNASAVNGSLVYDWKRIGAKEVPGVGGDGYDSSKQRKPPVKALDGSVFAEVPIQGGAGGNGAMRLFMGRNEEV